MWYGHNREQQRPTPASDGSQWRPASDERLTTASKLRKFSSCLYARHIPKQLRPNASGPCDKAIIGLVSLCFSLYELNQYLRGRLKLCGGEGGHLALFHSLRLLPSDDITPLSTPISPRAVFHRDKGETPTLLLFRYTCMSERGQVCFSRIFRNVGGSP
jgi:hypothetical protein